MTWVVEKTAGPSSPVEITGLNDVPQAVTILPSLKTKNSSLSW
jgi:hypothetical protein